MDLQMLLSDSGWKRKSYEYNKKSGDFKYTNKGNMYHFSSIESGRIDNRWLKDGKEIVFGLHEFNKPPTLIYPRPIGVDNDDQMNRLLQEDVHKVFKEIIKLL